MTEQHGYNAYRRGCRCDICRAANTERCAEYRAKRLERAASDGVPDDVEHGHSAYQNWGCRCDICRASVLTFNAQLSQRGRSGKPSHPRGGWQARCACDSCKVRMARYLRWRNAESLDGAVHYGEEWTGPQMEVAARDDITDKQAAQILGRTISAVHSARHALRVDPRKQRLGERS